MCVYVAASVDDDVAFDGDAQQLPFSVLDVVAQVNVRRSVDHVHLHLHTQRDRSVTYPRVYTGCSTSLSSFICRKV